MMAQLKNKANLVLWLTLAVFFVAATNGQAFAQYEQFNLVSTSSPSTPNNDAHLVNAWGLAFFPTSPFWVSDAFSGVSTLYDHSGMPLNLVVAIPPAPSQPFGPAGLPSGIVANPTSDFVISKNGKAGPALFIFATLDGTISGWNPNVDPNNAVIAIDNSTKVPFPAGYTGLAIGRNSSGQNVIFAADGGFNTLATSNNEIDMYDGKFNLIGHMSDPKAPSNMTVYGIQNVKGKLYVTYAAFTLFAGGAIDIFNGNGKLTRRVTRNGPEGPLQSPWGTALAPGDFGTFSNDLLFGNVDDGHINAFDPKTGSFLGQLTHPNGKKITISGLWGLQFGAGNPANGDTNQLFFTAGTNGYRTGLFGMITAKGTD
jgi:uncharacterized protein (TIGR03118 family)